MKIEYHFQNGLMFFEKYRMACPLLKSGNFCITGIQWLINFRKLPIFYYVSETYPGSWS